MDVLGLSGRIFPLWSLGAGIGHFAQREVVTGYGASKVVPAAGPLVPVPGGVVILGGLMVSVGVWPNLGALLLVAFLVPTAVLMHGFWHETDPARETNEQTQSQFLTIWSLAGAALALFAFFAAEDDLGLVVPGLLFPL